MLQLPKLSCSNFYTQRKKDGNIYSNNAEYLLCLSELDEKKYLTGLFVCLLVDIFLLIKSEPN